MKKFEISITQTSKMYVEVEAETLEQAKQRVTKEWYRGEHPMDENHFLSVEFDGEEKQNEKMKVVLLEPGKLAREAEIDGTLEGMQSVVGGLIEPGYYFEEPVCVVLNEEGKMIDGLRVEIAVVHQGKIVDLVFGNVVFASVDDEGNTIGLTEEQMQFVTEELNRQMIIGNEKRMELVRVLSI